MTASAPARRSRLPVVAGVVYSVVAAAAVWGRGPLLDAVTATSGAVVVGCALLALAGFTIWIASVGLTHLWAIAAAAAEPAASIHQNDPVAQPDRATVS